MKAKLTATAALMMAGALALSGCGGAATSDPRLPGQERRAQRRNRLEGQIQISVSSMSD